LEEFDRLCEDQFRQSRLDVALQRQLSRRPELEIGAEVLVRSRKTVKHDPKWHHEVYTVKEVFNSQVTVQDGEGYEQTFALKDVKRYGGAPNRMGDDNSEAEPDEEVSDRLDELCGLDGEVVPEAGAMQPEPDLTQEFPHAAQDAQDVDIPTHIPNGKRSRKPSFKQVMLDVERELKRKRRRKEGKQGDPYDAFSRSSQIK
jgi:hypothetical protein